MGTKSKSTRLDPKSKVRLLRCWLHYLYENTESWADQEIGTDIAYLVMAVINDEQVEWTESNPTLKLILKKDPKRTAAIWKFIRLVSPVDR